LVVLFKAVRAPLASFERIPDLFLGHAAPQAQHDEESGAKVRHWCSVLALSWKLKGAHILSYFGEVLHNYCYA
jgi:hypothetical protein